VFEFSLRGDRERGRKRPRHPRRDRQHPPDARNDFLYDLPRAEASENAAIDEACIGLIGISNDLKFVDSLEPKVKSTLGERGSSSVRTTRTNSATFSATTRISFRDGVLSDDVIPLAAAFTAQSAATFDKGLKILEKAGEYARMDGSSTVTEEHAPSDGTIETDEILDSFDNDLTRQQALAYVATTLAIIEPEHDARTKRIYTLYSSIAPQAALPVLNGNSTRVPRPALDAGDSFGPEDHNQGRRGGRRFIYEVTDDPVDIVNAVVKIRTTKTRFRTTSGLSSSTTKGDEATSYEAPDPADETQQQIWKFTRRSPPKNTCRWCVSPFAPSNTEHFAGWCLWAVGSISEEHLQGGVSADWRLLDGIFFHLAVSA